MMSFDVMTKYGMFVALVNNVIEHVRACSELRAGGGNNKNKTAQGTKDESIHYRF